MNNNTTLKQKKTNIHCLILHVYELTLTLRIFLATRPLLTILPPATSMKGMINEPKKITAKPKNTCRNVINVSNIRLNKCYREFKFV